MQYNFAATYLGYKEKRFPEFFPEGKPQEQALRFINFGTFLHEIDSAGIVTASGKWLDESLADFSRPRLRNPDEYQQTVSEIRAGSIYANMDYDVYFIEEGNQKAPDLWIPFQDSEIKIECKRCGTPGSIKDRKGIYESLINRITSATHNPSIFLFDLDRLPSPKEAQNVDQYLPSELNRRTEKDIEAPFGDIHILSYMEYTRTKGIPSYGLDSDEQLEFLYDYYIKPAIYAKTGEELDLYDSFESATIEPDGNKVAVSPKTTEYFDPMFVGIRYDGDDDLITPVVRQFDAARGKFGKEDPNILHIEVPYLDELSQEQFEELHQRLRGKLNVNSRVSVVVVTKEYMEWDDEDCLNYATFVGSEENLDPYINLPSSFHIPGYSLTEMRENPMFET